MWSNEDNENDNDKTLMSSHEDNENDKTLMLSNNDHENDKTLIHNSWNASRFWKAAIRNYHFSR